jgi:hypothetical protein
VLCNTRNRKVAWKYIVLVCYFQWKMVECVLCGFMSIGNEGREHNLSLHNVLLHFI